MLRILVISIYLLNVPAFAIEPSEQLADPALEARARALSKQLRCLVCQNETIDESNAPLARDLRIHVRRLLSDGLDDQEILDDIASRYGEFALMMPVIKGTNWLLYLSIPVMLVMAIGLASRHVRRQAAMAADSGLSTGEQQRLGELVGESAGRVPSSEPDPADNGDASKSARVRLHSTGKLNHEGIEEHG